MGKSIFSRGLPKVEYLQEAVLAEVFREVNHRGEIEVIVPPTFSSKKMDPTISLAHKNSWLYSEPMKPSRATLLTLLPHRSIGDMWNGSYLVCLRTEQSKRRRLLISPLLSFVHQENPKKT